MYRFNSIKYITACANITAILFVVGNLSAVFFKMLIPSFLSDKIALQLSDGLFIPFCAFFPGPMMLFSGAIAVLLIDFNAGLVHFAPFSIIIRILMFATIKLLLSKKWYNVIFSFFLASVYLVIGYAGCYLLFFNNYYFIIWSIISDIVQAILVYLLAIIIYYLLKRRKNLFIGLIIN